MGRLIGIKSDVGNRRTLNEDFVKYFEDDNISIFAIADGMGGHNAGEVASEVALETIITYLKENNEKDKVAALKEAVRRANYKIYKMSILNDNYSGMGTTITVAYVVDGKILIANVGDSRCYTFYKNTLTKITKDHSLVQELLDNGSISEEEAINHPNKNIITRAIGTKSSVEVDIYELNIDDVETVLLCTDGLTNEVSEQEICDIINNDKTNCCEELINLSKERGGRDNISVIIFKGECGDDRNHIRG